jgi:hypothetical protein
MASRNQETPSTDELLSDEEIRARHAKDRHGVERTEQILREIREGTASGSGIGGEELRTFLREHS